MWAITVIGAGSQAPPAGVVEALLREAFSVELLGPVRPVAPVTPLLLAFVDGGADAAMLEKLVRWRSR